MFEQYSFARDPRSLATAAFLRWGIVASVVALTSCKGAEPITSAATVTSIQVQPGTAGASSVGQTVRFTATAIDASGGPISGVSFTWISSVPGVATVDAAGVATAATNGSTTIQASAQGVTGSGSLTVAQQPVALSIVGGNGQSGLARLSLTALLRVSVLDGLSNPIPGHAVTWQVLSGGGSVIGSAADGSGQSSATWTLGPIQGPGSVRASAGLVSTTFTSTSLPNGTIQGTVTRSSAYLGPARAAVAAAGALAPQPGARISNAKTAPAPSTTPPTVRANREGSVPGELLVRLRTTRLAVPAVGSLAYRSPGQSESAARAMRSAASRWEREEPLEVLGTSPALATVRVRVPTRDTSSVRERLLRRPEVESVELNGLVRATEPMESEPRSTIALRGTSYAPAAAANEPDFALQAWHYDLIGALRAWEVTTGSPSVIVAVVDDGIRFDHPDIATNLRSDGYDFVTYQLLPGCSAGVYSTSMDGDGPDPDPTIPASLSYDADFDCVVGLESEGGHGLHVAGTIGARAANGQGGVGVAWQIGIRPVRVLGSQGSGNDYDIAQGILYAAGLPADNGSGGTVQVATRAHVINLSLGSSGSSAMIQGAVQAATAAGSLLIAAAGNDGTSAPSYPAAYPEVLSVSAIAPDFTLASYSNFGPTIDIAAPGGELLNGDDYAVWSLRWNFQVNAPAYAALHGTSMAAPHVSGVAALVLAANPGLTSSQLRTRLLDHATDLGPAGSDNSFGAGLVNADASVRNGGEAPRDTYVWAFDEQTGRAYGPVRASSGGGYSINALPDGSYWVYAGEDRNGDLRTGVFDRLWGGLGGSTTPGSVAIAQSSIVSASFDFGFPAESENNGTLPTADRVPMGGYSYGAISPSADVDLYRVDLAQTTTILVETDGLFGACGLAGQVDTVVRILDSVGNPLAENDDINTDARRHCSRIQATLAAGTYYVEVTGWSGDVGYYAVRVAAGP